MAIKSKMSTKKPPNKAVFLYILNKFVGDGAPDVPLDGVLDVPLCGYATTIDFHNPPIIQPNRS